MAKTNPATKFLNDFLARTALARDAKNMSQQEMATALEPGMKQDTYKQYETRTPLPHRYIPTFCALTDIEPNWLFTGQGKGVKATKAIRPAKSRAA